MCLDEAYQAQIMDRDDRREEILVGSQKIVWDDRQDIISGKNFQITKRNSLKLLQICRTYEFMVRLNTQKLIKFLNLTLITHYLQQSPQNNQNHFPIYFQITSKNPTPKIIVNKIIVFIYNFTYIQQTYQAKTPTMSSLPDVFRTMQSEYIRPTKQGGIYTLKYGHSNKELAEKIQPEQFYSVRWTKVGESRIGTSHTIRTQQFSSMANTRPITSSESHRKVTSRKSFSRPSSQSIRKDIFANYGTSRVSFVIQETAPPSIQQAQSLVHQLNQNIKQGQICQKQLAQITKMQRQLRENITIMNSHFTAQIQEIQDNVINQLGRLRKSLSTLRRSSGMDIKVNKTDANDLSDNLKTIATVMDEIDVKSLKMHRLCLK